MRKIMAGGSPCVYVMLLLAGTASAQTTSSPVPAQIVTTGTGEVRIAPDRATIFIGVQSRGLTAAAASADNAKRQRAIIDTLRALGLGSEQLSTMNYNVAPEIQYGQNNQPPKVTGYSVTNTVRADVRRIEDIARAIDASLAKGANEISGLQFFSSRADSVRRSALSVAVANARADAEALARAAGGSLGPLLEVSTAPSIRPMQEVVGVRAMAARAPTPIEPGEQSVTVSVTTRWLFVAR